VDVQQGVPELVGQLDRGLEQVGVVAGQHTQLGQRLLVAADPAQGVRQRAGDVCDHEGVAGIGLGPWPGCRSAIRRITSPGR
jgi:hypothetical protein